MESLFHNWTDYDISGSYFQENYKNGVHFRNSEGEGPFSDQQCDDSS